MAALALAMAAQSEGADPMKLRQEVRAWRTAHEKEVVGELAALLALRNVAADRADIQRNADLLIEMLRKRGFQARLLAAGGSPPAVYGELPSPGARHTVVFYAHYDGQPADPVHEPAAER